MERHKCKLCFRSFSNGKALGGHMRSHMMSLPIPSKPEEEEEEEEEENQLDEDEEPSPQKNPTQLSEEAESASSLSSSSDEEGEDEKGLYYELRENPQRSIRLVDPEFSLTVDAGSVVLQDRESETESSKNPTRRRSKRTRKLGIMIEKHHQYHPQKIDQGLEAIKKIKLNKPSNTESWVEPEPMSSVSDATTEEDVAYCLMMLSRDKWKKKEQEEEEQQDEGVRSNDESEKMKSSKVRTRGKYKCDTCKKIFKSYQALGGHRASHKKNIKLIFNYNNFVEDPEVDQQENAGTSTSVAEKKIHECPICFRVFSSGQALGGHKRSHVIGSSSTTNNTIQVKSFTKLEDKDSLIDLNLPAPVDDDDDDDDEISQIELSAVSDAEFINPIKQYSKFSR